MYFIVRQQHKRTDRLRCCFNVLLLTSKQRPKT